MPISIFNKIVIANSSPSYDVLQAYKIDLEDTDLNVIKIEKDDILNYGLHSNIIEQDNFTIFEQNRDKRAQLFTSFLYFIMHSSSIGNIMKYGPLLVVKKADDVLVFPDAKIDIQELSAFYPADTKFKDNGSGISELEIRVASVNDGLYALDDTVGHVYYYKIELENIEEPFYWLSVHNIPDAYRTNPMPVIRIASEIRKFYRESGIEPNLEVIATLEYIDEFKDISKIKLTKIC